MPTPVPTSKADVDKVFQDLVMQLASTAQKLGTYFTTPGASMPAMVPAADGPGLRELEKLEEPFSRETLNETYIEVHKDAENPGTTGDAIGLKVQADWLAVAERGYRVRHASPIRDILHMAARYRGHGHAQGVFQFGTLGFVQDIIKAGKS